MPNRFLLRPFDPKAILQRNAWKSFDKLWRVNSWLSSQF